MIKNIILLYSLAFYQSSSMEKKIQKSGIKNMNNNLEYISIMRYNKKHKYRIFGDGCNSLPAVIVTDYLAGW